MNMTKGTLQILYEIALQRIIIVYLDKSTLPMYPGNEESTLLKNKNSFCKCSLAIQAFKY